MTCGLRSHLGALCNNSFHSLIHITRAGIHGLFDKHKHNKTGESWGLGGSIGGGIGGGIDGGNGNNGTAGGSGFNFSIPIQLPDKHKPDKHNLTDAIGGLIDGGIGGLVSKHNKTGMCVRSQFMN